MPITSSELLQQVRSLAAEGALSEAELLDAYRSGLPVQEGDAHLSFTDLFYYLGSLVVILGFSVFVFQSAHVWSATPRVLLALGLPILMYLAGTYLTEAVHNKVAGQAFHLMAALAFPVGLFVYFDVTNLFTSGSLPYVLLTGILFAGYLLSYWIAQRPIFILFSILYGTGFVFTFCLWLVEVTQWQGSEMLPFYLLFLAGAEWMLLGYGLRQKNLPALSGFFKAFGAIAVLVFGLVLTGWQPDQNVFFEILYPLLPMGILYLGLLWRFRPYFVFGALGMAAYILKITFSYFSNSLSWPVALMLAGLVIIGAGFLSVRLSRLVTERRS